MKISEAYLGTLERGIRAFADGSPVATILVCEGRVVHANAATLTLFRTTVTELLGRAFADLVPPELASPELDAIHRAMVEGTSGLRASFVLRSDGTRARVDTVGSASLWNGNAAVLVRLTERAEGGPEVHEDRRRVLVVDDEVVIGNVVRRILRDHEVVHVTDAEQAMALLGRESFDVILCDVMMPGLSGVDLFEMVSREQPLLQKRFVFVTGGAFTKRARDFLANVPNPRIDKPFEAAAIREAVSSLSALPH